LACHRKAMIAIKAASRMYAEIFILKSFTFD
jgi:hypothetical protein